MTADRPPSTAHRDSSAPHCYLVTGAAGFIASRVCELLLAEGHSVVGVDNLNDYYDVRLKLYRLGRIAQQAGVPETEVIRYGLSVNSEKFSAPRTNNSEPITLKSDRFEFRVLDIENLEALDEVFRAHKFEAVFNLAARAGVRASLENPELYRRTNVLGEENVLKCQVKYGVGKHVVASSSSVYAGCPMPFVEDAALGRMQSPYAETKRTAELLALEYHEKHGIDVSALRYFTVFGPAGRPDMAPFRFVKWIAEGTPIALNGDGNQTRDFTYVDDIARGTVLAARLLGGQSTVAPSSPGFDEASGGQPVGEIPPTDYRQPATGNRSPSTGYEVINLGGGNRPITINAMIALIEKELNRGGQSAVGGGQLVGENRQPATGNRSPAAPFKALINRQPPSAADMTDTQADIAKAGRLLDWKPEVSPEQGFKRTVEWYIANREWLKDIKL